MTKLREQPFTLLGVHVGGSTPDQLKAVMVKENITWRSFVDEGNAGTGQIAKRWNHFATPTYYLIDHKGVIRHKWAGPPSEKTVDSAIDSLLKTANRSTE